MYLLMDAPLFVFAATLGAYFVFGGFEERAGHVQRPAPPMPMPTQGARAQVAKHTDTTGFCFFFFVFFFLGGGGIS